MRSGKIFFSIIILIILGAFVNVAMRPKKATVSAGHYDDFAQCLASANLTMYGAVSCSHCQAEKALFGDSFKDVSYVECTENPKLCLDKGIEGYPTWIDKNGRKYVGEQGLERLSEISGCALPAQ